jgi:hypothetical protein
MVGCAYIEGKVALRLLVTNVSIGRAEIDRYFADLVAEGRVMAGERQTGGK